MQGLSHVFGVRRLGEAPITLHVLLKDPQEAVDLLSLNLNLILAVLLQADDHKWHHLLILGKLCLLWAAGRFRDS